jgi:hypothetical protein
LPPFFPGGIEANTTKKTPQKNSHTLETPQKNENTRWLGVFYATF